MRTKPKKTKAQKQAEHATLPKQITQVTSVYNLKLLDSLTGNKTI